METVKIKLASWSNCSTTYDETTTVCFFLKTIFFFRKGNLRPGFSALRESDKLKAIRFSLFSNYML